MYRTRMCACNAGGDSPETGGDSEDGEGEGPRDHAPDERAGASVAEAWAEWEEHEPHFDLSQPRVSDADLGQDSSRLGLHAGGGLGGNRGGGGGVLTRCLPYVI